MRRFTAKAVAAFGMVAALIAVSPAPAQAAADTSAAVEQNPGMSWTAPTGNAAASTWADAGKYDISWYEGNESADEYTLMDAADLAGLAYLVNNEAYSGSKKGVTFEGKTIKLGGDIKLNESAVLTEDGELSNNGSGLTMWKPIGCGPSRYSTSNFTFKGTFDGDGHTISGLYITDTATSHTWQFFGLFGVTEDATIKNVKIADCYIYLSIPLSQSGSSFAVGGVVGDARNSTVIDTCTVEGTIALDARAMPSSFKKVGIGGIVGQVGSYESGDSMSVKNCQFDGRVLGYAENMGGIVGSASSFEISGCENRGVVANQATDADYTGGVIGEAGDTSDASHQEITDCDNCGGVVAASGVIGGVVGGYNFNHGSGATTAVLSSCTNEGTVQAADGTGNVIVGGVVGSVNRKATCTDLLNTGVVAVGSRDGATVSGASATLGGVVGSLTGATLTDSVNRGALIDVQAEGTQKKWVYAGGVVGEASGYVEECAVERCVNTGTISVAQTKDALQSAGDDSGVGGIVGKVAKPTVASTAANVTIGQCWNGGDITSGAIAGGIVGNNDAAQGILTVECCYNLGDVKLTGVGTSSSASLYAGGITGLLYKATVKACYNVGAVTLDGETDRLRCGGIAGLVQRGWGTVDYCYALDTCVEEPMGIAAQDGTRLTMQQMTDDDAWATTFAGFDAGVWAKKDRTATEYYLPHLSALAGEGAGNVRYSEDKDSVQSYPYLPFVPVESITLSVSDLSLTVYKTGTLTATVSPDNATDPTITWSSSDEKVASVDADGTVTANGVGTATVTAAAGDGKTATCTVTVDPIQVTIGGVQAGTDLVYSAEPQQGYAGTPKAVLVDTTDKPYEGDFAVSYYAGSKVEGEPLEGAPADAGTYTVRIGIPEGEPNYEGSIDLTFTIAKAALTVKADDESAIYGDALPEFTVSYDEFKGDDDAATALTGEPTLSCGYRQGDDVGGGSYAIELSLDSVSSDNYELAAQNGALTVSPRTVAIWWGDPVAGHVVGDGVDVIAGIDNIYEDEGGTDDVSLVVEGADADAAGSHTAKVTSLAGEDADNYALPAEGDPSLTHAYVVAQSGVEFPDGMTVENGEGVETSAFTYGETMVVTVAPEASGEAAEGAARASNALTEPVADQMALYYRPADGSDDLQLTEPVDAQADGTYRMEYDTVSKLIPCDAVTLVAKYVGTDDVASGEISADVTLAPKALAASFEGPTEKVYDGTTEAPEGLTLELDGLEQEDANSVSVEAGSITYDAADAGKAASITAYGVTLAGDATTSAFYAIASTLSTQGTIAARDIADADVTLGAPLTYTGEEQTQGIVSIDADGIALDLAKDCVISGDTATDAGDYTLTITGTGNFTGIVEVPYAVAKAAGSVTVAPVEGITVGDEPFTLDVTAVGDGGLSYASSDENVLTVDAQGKVTIVGSGTATVTVTLADGANYAGASASIGIEVAAKPAAEDPAAEKPGDTPGGSSGSSSEGGTLAQTGDATPVAAIAAVGIAGVALVAAGVVARRRMR